MSSGTVLVGYCLWAFEKAHETSASVPWYQLSILPFVLGLLRYALLVDQGKGDAPEEIVLSDRPLQLIGLVLAPGLRPRDTHGVSERSERTVAAERPPGSRMRWGLGAQPPGR